MRGASGSEQARLSFAGEHIGQAKKLIGLLGGILESAFDGEITEGQDTIEVDVIVPFEQVGLLKALAYADEAPKKPGTYKESQKKFTELCEAVSVIIR